MKTLKQILNHIEHVLLAGDLNTCVENICFDSRKANSSSVFVAISGWNNDGHNFIPSAYDNGCRVFVVQNSSKINYTNSVIIKVENTSQSLGLIARNFYENPSKKIKLIGITGTNGKTTTCTLLHAACERIGIKAGLISTVINKIGKDEYPSTHTTPDPVQLNYLLSKMVQSECEYCFMEVSSHAIHQGRIHGLNFTLGAFTNITHDHLDYHKSFNEYIQVKKSFFDQLPSSAIAISNADDRNGKIMLQNCKSSKHYYALKNEVEYKGKIIENSFFGLMMNINGRECHSQLIGSFNAYNILLVYGILSLLEIDKDEALKAISILNSVQGRFEIIRSKVGRHAIVDYAHTPDALENIINTINDIKKNNQRLICVVGCGGDRDISKRPIMGKIASDKCDTVILTSDNPRSEDPQSILDQMEKGVSNQSIKKILQIVDRKQAIKTAIKMSSKEDIILIAGKGHEKYQEIAGIKYDFDDLNIASELFNEMEK